MVLVGIGQTNRRIRSLRRHSRLGYPPHEQKQILGLCYLDSSATDMIFNGIGEAMDWLQKQYDGAVQ